VNEEDTGVWGRCILRTVLPGHSLSFVFCSFSYIHEFSFVFVDRKVFGKPPPFSDGHPSPVRSSGSPVPASFLQRGEEISFVSLHQRFPEAEDVSLRVLDDCNSADIFDLISVILEGVTTNGGEAGMTQFFRVPVMETPASEDL
jgi:hypothetical protein